METKPILVTGSTGYVGGRLVPQLLQAGYRVRALGRSLAKLEGRPWGSHPLVELAAGDVMDQASLVEACRGCWAAFYLVHSMIADPKGYTETDRTAAQNMVEAAAETGLNRIVYLGGLGGKDDPHLSAHLRSRYEVARILQSGPVPATFLRAAMILGSGSVSFEMLRYLVERLPVMITPRWVDTQAQPIGIRNVLNYLQGCLEHEEVLGQTYDIGGPEVVSYRRLFQIYAEEAGLRKRIILSIPFFTPSLSAYWIHLITPVPSSIARPLAEGLRNAVICHDNRIREIIPQELLDCRQTIRLALQRIQQERVDTCWMDASAAITQEWFYCGDTPYAGGTTLELGYAIQIQASKEEVWKPLKKIGGKTGWYFGTGLWKIRGWFDRLTGGIGFRAGRRHASELRSGDALDFWRVLEAIPGERLLLQAEMKVPGQALLEFKIKPLANGVTELQQVARFLPKGLGGILYWYVFDPFHRLLYPRMLKAIARDIARPIVQGPQRVAERKNIPPGKRREK